MKNSKRSLTGGLELNGTNKHTIKEEQDEEEVKTNGRSLSLRPDVMNKNIFRAIRRECKNLFSASFKSKKNFLPNLHKFTETLLNETKVNWQDYEGFHRDDFTKYFGILISYCGMKKTLEEAKDRHKLDTTNSLLYKYTHRGFHDYISIAEIRIIIQIIFEQVGISAIISHNPTLKANEKEYFTRMKRLETRVSNSSTLESIIFE